MITSYIRSSSFTTHDDCEQRYLLEYVLGWRGKGNLKCDAGTIVHGVLEQLAIIKLAQQNKETYIENEYIGKLDVNEYKLDHIIEKVYLYFTKLFDHHNWTEESFNFCKTSVYKAIEFNNGTFDPRNRTIVLPEQHFDIEIKQPWAAYKHIFQGKEYSGQLALKGTVDLITSIDDRTLEIIDWKTGKKFDWNRGIAKDYASLKKDPQLLIYHYAVHCMYPEVEQVVVTIFFINDGGPFTLCFNKSDLPQTEEMLKRKFEQIKKTQTPKLNKTWKCSKLCFQGLSTFENTNIKPMVEFRRGQLTPYGKVMTKCEQTKFETDKKGLQWVTDNYTNQKHSINNYKEPGKKE